MHARGLAGYSICFVLLVSACLVNVRPAVACDGCSKHSHADAGHISDGAGSSSEHSHGIGLQMISPSTQDSVTASSTPFSFAVVADTQGNPGPRDFVSQLAADINSQSPDFTVFPGDLVGTGSVATFAEWNTATGILGNNRYMVPGNHDLPGRPATNSDWQTAFNWLPDSQVVPNITTSDPNDTVQGVNKMDYYFDMGNTRFISVTSDRDAIPGETSDVLGGTPRALDWYQSVMSLPSTQSKDHIFVFTHHSVTTQPSDALGGVAGEWWQSVAGRNEEFDLPAATALMSGHWHFYQPSRPDPLSDTLELIHGTGGGSLEGAPQHAIHGFSVITIDGSNVTAKFYGDADGATGGWSFDDLLDEYVITGAGGVPKGELTRYEFNDADPTVDNSLSPVSKGHGLNFNGSVTAFDETERPDVALFTGGFIDAKATGEGNLAVVGDLTLSLKAKAVTPLSPGIDNMLLAFGDADDSLDFATTQMEAANYAYQLSYMQDGRLRLAWEYGVQVQEEVFSTSPIASPEQWQDIEVRRDADSQTVAFLVNGVQLGAPVPFDNNATGAGAGSLYIGSLPDGASNYVGFMDDIVISNSAVDVFFGDLDLDSDLDLDDWRTLKAGLSQPLGGNDGDYFLGDLDLNGQRGLADLVEFRKAFERAQGMTIEAALELELVPEPSAAILFIGSALCLWRSRTRYSAQVFAVAFIAMSVAPLSNVLAVHTIFYEDFEGVTLGPSVDETTIPNPNAWTDTPPVGWNVDDSGIPHLASSTQGVTEWKGWSFTDKTWWSDIAGDQNRSQFTLASGNVAVADPDEWDDKGSPINGSFQGYYDALMTTPAISLVGVPEDGAQLSFSSSWRDECCDDGPADLNNQTATIRASFDGGANYSEILRWESDSSSPFFKNDATNESVTIDINNPTGAVDVILEFGLTNAGNDWWWAIDNVEVTAPSTLQVDTVSGEMAILGVDDIIGYEITGPTGSLDPNRWEQSNLDAQNIGPLVPLSTDVNNSHLVDVDDISDWIAAYAIDDSADTDSDSLSTGLDFLNIQQEFGASLADGASWETLISEDNQLLEFFLGGSSSFVSQSIGQGYDTALGSTSLGFKYTDSSFQEFVGAVTYTSAITIATSVPEPGAFLLCVGCCLPLAMRERRLRK